MQPMVICLAFLAAPCTPLNRAYPKRVVGRGVPAAPSASCCAWAAGDQSQALFSLNHTQSLLAARRDATPYRLLPALSHTLTLFEWGLKQVQMISRSPSDVLSGGRTAPPYEIVVENSAVTWVWWSVRGGRCFELCDGEYCFGKGGWVWVFRSGKR